MKKGISPLLSWVLLIGFAISMGTLILIWSTDLIGDLDLGGNEIAEMYCNNVKIDIEEIHVDPLEDSINATLRNVGERKIRALTFSKETNNSPSAHCYELNLDISIGDTELFGPLSLDVANLSSTGIDQCKSYNKIPGQARPTTLYMISLVPWIEVDGELITCNDQEFRLDSEKGNNLEILEFLNQP